MLRNKYVVAALGAGLIIVVAYNVAFFKERSAKRAAGTQVQDPAVTFVPRAKATIPRQALPGSSAEEWRRDPFWYPGGRARVAPPAERKQPGLRLEATVTKGEKAYAIISGDIVGIGEQFQGYIVTEIGDQFVKLKGPGGTKTLKLAGDSTKKE